MDKGKSERDQRLAQALRDNLRRRKGQARQWAQGEPQDASADPRDKPDDDAH